MERAVIIFGVKGDGLYNQTQLAFTLVAGLGQSGNAKFSTALVATLAASLGVPVLAFVGESVKTGLGLGWGWE